MPASLTENFSVFLLLYGGISVIHHAHNCVGLFEKGFLRIFFFSDLFLSSVLIL